MIENGRFNEKDLNKCSWQYAVRHQSTDNFCVGENIFLGSNPEVPMIVLKVHEKEIYANVIDLLGNINTYTFPPQCVLQYKYASLIVYKDKYNVCLN